jgi:catechol 2,3-dioxygenase-like lactoylglutathione lyase family enzyme
MQRDRARFDYALVQLPHCVPGEHISERWRLFQSFASICVVPCIVLGRFTVRSHERVQACAVKVREVMFSHITVGSNDLQRAEIFYNNVLNHLGLRPRVVRPDGGPPALCWVSRSRMLPRFYVYRPRDGNSATPGNGSMTAFLAASTNAVDAAYAAAIEAGGKDGGAPGPRAQYGDGYYGAYFFDLDGNKIHLVFRTDLY